MEQRDTLPGNCDAAVASFKTTAGDKCYSFSVLFAEDSLCPRNSFTQWQSNDVVLTVLLIDFLNRFWFAQTIFFATILTHFLMFIYDKYNRLFLALKVG